MMLHVWICALIGVGIFAGLSFITDLIAGFCSARNGNAYMFNRIWAVILSIVIPLILLGLWGSS